MFAGQRCQERANHTSDAYSHAYSHEVHKGAHAHYDGENRHFLRFFYRLQLARNQKLRFNGRFVLQSRNAIEMNVDVIQSCKRMRHGTHQEPKNSPSLNKSPTHLANMIGSISSGVTSNDFVASATMTTALLGRGGGEGYRRLRGKNTRAMADEACVTIEHRCVNCYLIVMRAIPPSIAADPGGNIQLQQQEVHNMTGAQQHSGSADLQQHTIQEKWA